MRAVKSVSIDSDRRVIITFLDGSTETLYPNCIWCDSEALRQLIKDLLEEKADAITQTIENVTIATFADGADEALIRKLLVSIEPIQEGSGDPSPENVRPISGWTGAGVVRCGKNLLDKASYKYITDTNIVWGASANNTWADGSLTLEAGTYTFSCSDTVNGIYIADQTQNIAIKYTVSSLTFTLSQKTPIKIMIYKANSSSSELLGMNYQIELGSAATDYEPYKGSICTVNWETEAGTVYGGSLNVISGKLSVDRGYIASYNGETLPSTWISDRDVYAEGATPTTGAQVVYKLAEPVEYQLEKHEITTLLGANNIWADSGNILELEYVADTKLYIGESQSGILGSGRQTISNTDLQPVSEKTWEDISESYKAETTEKETQEEKEDERGE